MSKPICNTFILARKLIRVFGGGGCKLFPVSEMSDELTLPLPTEISVYPIVHILNVEKYKLHHIQVGVCYPTGWEMKCYSDVFQTDGWFEPKRIIQIHPEDATVLKLAEAGIYKFHFRLDGELLGARKLEVFHEKTNH